MSNWKFIHRRLAPVAAMLLGVGSVALAADTPEVEPNETKAQATPVAAPLAPLDTLSGSTTGSSTTVPGDASADTFLVQTAAAPLGIYRHRLVLSSDTLFHSATIRGLNQTAGVPGTTDSTAQTNSSTTTPPRFVQWYGFGKQEQLYYRVTGTSTTTSPYLATHEVEEILATDIGNFISGQIVITTLGQGHSSDTDLWLYDENLNAIVDAGNDDESVAGGGTGATLQSRLVRTLTPGTYYLAITNFNFANNLGSPADDDFRTGTVLDFPDAAINSSTTTGINVTFTISDEFTNSQQVPGTKTEPFQVLWFKFQLAAPAPFGACCLSDGTCLENQSAADCATAGGAYRGDGTDCTPNFCIGACCLDDGTCVETTATNCASLSGDYRGDGTNCGSANCPPAGACCLSDGTCQNVTAARCGELGGNFRGTGTDCGSTVCTGACCLPDDTCVADQSPDQCATLGGLFRGVGSACGNCDDIVDQEPNDNKGQAQDAPMGAGGRITGTSTGSSTVTPGNASADYFKVTTAAAPLGIYRHRLISTGGTVNGATLRGLTQTAGVPNAGTDATFQTASATSTPPRHVQWYGFGKQEMIYFRVTGLSTTTAPYEFTLETVPVTPTAVPGTFIPGEITITTVGQGHSNDTDLWVYDSNLNAIVDAGNDDESVAGGGTGTTLQSILRRNYAAGLYYISMSDFNNANNLGSPPDDDFRTGTLLDFPDANANGDTNAAGLNVTFSIIDGAGAVQVPALFAEGDFENMWFSFQVGNPCPGERGDTNCDGNIDFFDIDPFLLALFDLPAYQATFCGGSTCAADIDCTGQVDFFDIDPFLACLFDVNGCPACP